jgi:hypothetical protein
VRRRLLDQRPRASLRDFTDCLQTVLELCQAELDETIARAVA